MLIELAETDISGIVTHGNAVLGAAVEEYQRLRREFPGITDDEIRQVKALLKRGSRENLIGGVNKEVVALAAFNWMAETCAEQFSLLQGPDAKAENVRIAFAGIAELFRPLAALVLFLKGAPLSLSFVLTEVTQQRAHAGGAGGVARAKRLKNLRDRTIELCNPWQWSTAKAARLVIEPEIRKLDVEPKLLKPNTVLTWIRKHRSNKNRG